MAGVAGCLRPQEWHHAVAAVAANSSGGGLRSTRQRERRAPLEVRPPPPAACSGSGPLFHVRTQERTKVEDWALLDLFGRDSISCLQVPGLPFRHKC
jgi:hypothetical protein